MCLWPSLRVGGHFGFFFSARGRGRGEYEATGRGVCVGFLLKIPGEGGLQERGEGARGPGGCLRGIFLGGGGIIFFFGAEIPTKLNLFGLLLVLLT